MSASVAVPLAAADVFLVAAPSGAGKSSLVSALLARDPSIRLSVSFTTRAPRPGEVEGRDYHFVDREEFARRERLAEFLETAEVHGNRYGTSRAWIEQRLQERCDILLEIDWQGARQVKALFPSAIGVFILPPSMQALRERLQQRGKDAPEVIERRLQAARGEMTHAGEFDFVIVNDAFEQALLQLQAVVCACRLRSTRQADRHAELFQRLGVAGSPGA